MKSIELSTKIRRFSKFIAPIGCFLFSLLLLIFVFGPGDGTWQLYAREMEQGHRLYTDLGLNQQPIFPFLNWLALKLFGGGILASKLIFVPFIGLYVYFLYRLSRLNALGEGARAALLLAVFFVSIRFEAFRFDDYHALTGLLAVASLFVSAMFLRGRLAVLGFGVWQAVLTMAAALTRPNDGLALALAAGTVLLVRHGFGKGFVRMAGWSLAAAVAIFMATLACVGETPATWFGKSVLEASAAKGGGGLLVYPGLLLENSAEFVLSELVVGAWPYLAMFCLAWGGGIWLERRQSPARQLGWVIAPLSLVLLLFFALPAASLIENLAAVAALCVTIAAVLGIAWAVRGRLVPDATPGGALDWSLLAYPALLFLFGALSTGGAYYGLYPPIGITLLVIAMVGGQENGILARQGTTRAVFLTLCALIAWQAGTFRWNNPYSWLSYHVPAFSGDYLYRADARGPHVVPMELADLVDPVCDTVKPPQSLLSLPYSFANYYCGISPWRGYVQTFFDTSTEARISRLMGELRSDPPDFIFYQQQLPILRDHEVLFNRGAPLPQRALDALITEKIESGEWVVVDQTEPYPPSTWMLIQTNGR